MTPRDLGYFYPQALLLGALDDEQLVARARKLTDTDLDVTVSATLSLSERIAVFSAHTPARSRNNIKLVVICEAIRRWLAVLHAELDRRTALLKIDRELRELGFTPIGVRRAQA